MACYDMAWHGMAGTADRVGLHDITHDTYETHDTYDTYGTWHMVHGIIYDMP